MCIIQYFSELKMFKIIIVIVIILMMMMTFKDQFLLPYTCNIRVLFLNKVFLFNFIISTCMAERFLRQKTLFISLGFRFF